MDCSCHAPHKIVLICASSLNNFQLKDMKVVIDGRMKCSAETYSLACRILHKGALKYSVFTDRHPMPVVYVLNSSKDHAQGCA